MKSFKTKFLPIAGMLILIVFLGLSYKYGNLFMEKLMVCSVVLGVIFLIRTNENLSQSKNKSSGLNKFQNSSK